MVISDYVKKYFEPTENLRARDVAREIPTGFKKVGGKILGGLRSTGQAAFRAYAGIGGAVTGKILTPSTYFQKELFGTDKLITLRSVGAEVGLKESSKFTAPVGFALGVADLIPGGKITKSTATTILKNANKVDDVFKTLTKMMGVSKDVAKKYSPIIAKITDEAQISKYIDDVVKESQSVGRFVQKGKEAVKSVFRERGFVTSAKEVIPEAEKIAGQYIPRSTDKLAIKAVNLIKDNIKEAEIIAKSKTDDNAVAIASELLKHYSKQADLAVDIATKNAIYDQAAEIANITARNLTEQGRSVQAASILGRLTPEGQVRFAAKEIQNWNRLNPRAKVPEITGEQSKRIINEMKEIMNMAEGDAKAIRFQKLQNEIKALVPSKVLEKVIAVWKAGLLTGIKTSGLNIFANISHTGTEIIKDIPGTAVDILLSLFTGKRALTTSIKNLPTGVKKGVEKGFTYLRTGYDVRDVGAKLDYRRVNFKSKALQKYVDGVFRVLGAEDQPFYYGALSRSLYNQAKVAAINAGKKGKEVAKYIDDLIQNPTNEMIAYGLADAETAVFQNRTALGTVARTFQKIPGGEFIVPFGRTPSAVAMQMINYTPVGTFIEIGKQIARGKFDQRLLSQAIGRGTIGTGVLWVGGKLFDNDMMTLDYPQTEKERELWKVEGRKANSIKIGDKWRTVQTLGPVGPVMLLGGHFRNALKEGGSQTEAIIKAFFGSIKSFTEQTFLRGVNDLMSVISDPQIWNVRSFSASFISSWIPTIINDVARSIDSKERRTSTNSLMKEVLNRIQSRIPKLREGLEPQITTLGEERERIGNALEVMADPTRPSPDVSTDVVKELRRLTNEGYKVSPSLLGDRAGYKVLTDEQNTKLWKLAGGILNDKLEALFAKEQYQKLSDEEKGDIVKKFVKQAQINARAGMVIEITEGLIGEELKNKLSELKEGKLFTKDVFKKYQELR